MARRRKLSPERKEFINGLLEHYQPNDAHDVQEMLKDLLGDTLQGSYLLMVLPVLEMPSTQSSTSGRDPALHRPSDTLYDQICLFQRH